MQPADATVNAGEMARFMVAATGNNPLHYQWRKNEQNIAGATRANYTTPATTAADNGAQYSVVVTNAIGSATSNSATLTVISVTPPTITTQPASRTVRVGQVAKFTVVAAGSPPLAYQWRKNGIDISGANAASYSTPPATSGDNGVAFSVTVTNSAGTVVSDDAILTVR
jgi:hypothetical protein